MSERVCCVCGVPVGGIAGGKRVPYLSSAHITIGDSHQGAPLCPACFDKAMAEYWRREDARRGRPRKKQLKMALGGTA